MHRATLVPFSCWATYFWFSFCCGETPWGDTHTQSVFHLPDSNTHTFIHSLTPSVVVNGCIIVGEITGAVFGALVGQRGGGTSLVSKVGGGGAFKQILNTNSQTHLLTVNRHLTMQHYKYTSGGRPSGKTELTMRSSATWPPPEYVGNKNIKSKIK